MAFCFIKKQFPIKSRSLKEFEEIIQRDFPRINTKILGSAGEIDEETYQALYRDAANLNITPA